MSAPFRRRPLSAKRWWRSCWPTPSSRNSVVTRSARSRLTSRLLPPGYGSGSASPASDGRHSASHTGAHDMIRPILRYGADTLHRPASPVSDITPEIEQLIDDMIQTMYAAPGIGLAATQIGVGLRIFVA